MKTDVYDAIVVGGGPSGMMTAGHIAKSGASVLLLEANRELGKKLSITGGGRCNITNKILDNRELLENYGEAKKFLYSPFSKFSVKNTFSFFEKNGLPLVTEARNRVFPQTQKATDVTKTMQKFIEKNGVEVLLNTKVKDISKHEDVFLVKTGKQEFKAKNIVFAVGGPSGKTLSKEIPASWKILQKIGHTISAPSPDLVPLATRAKFVHRLSGLTMSFVALRFKVGEKTQFKKLGKVLFTHFGVSGPTIINSSRQALEILQKTGRLTLSIDFFPDTEFDKLDRRIVALLQKSPTKKFRNALSELVPEALSKTLIFIVNKDLMETRCSDVSREDRRQIVHKLKDFYFNIVGSMGFDWAIVADGGIALEEVDFKTMESKLMPGLFLTGDVLNINRPSGGFSLQLCWTTGFVAAQGVLQKLK